MTSDPTLKSMATTAPPIVVIPSQGRGRSNSLPTSVVEILKRWLLTHMNHPYPSDQEKAELCQQAGIDVKRLNNWFVNNRIRYWKPKMEALHQREPKKLVPSSSKPRAILPSLVLASSITNDTPTLVTIAIGSTPSKSSKKRPSPVSPSTAPPRLGLSHSPSVISEGSSSLVEDSDEENDDDNEAIEENGYDWCDDDPKDRILMSRHNQSSSLMTPNSMSHRLPYKKRSRLVESSFQSSLPRSKYSRKDEGLWRESCVTSLKINDRTLPTLDEAALLFGFATTNFDSPEEELEEH